MAKRIDRRHTLFALGGVLGIVPTLRGSAEIPDARAAGQRQAEAEPNDSRSEATRIGPGNVFGHIGPCCLPVAGDDEDWFAVDVDAGDGILVDFQQRPVSAAELIGPDGSVLDREGPSATRLGRSVSQSGTAYIHLMDPPGSANGDYAFSLTIEQGDDADGEGGASDDAGSTNNGGGSGTDSGSGDGSTFEVLSTDSDSQFSYRFSVDGDVAKTEYEGRAADDEDQIVACGDGTTTVVGYTGSGGGDVYQIEGDLLSFKTTSGNPDFELRLNGEDVTGSPPSGLPIFEVVSTADDTEFSYRFEVDGDVYKTVYRGRAADDDDHVVECADGTVTVVGSTGNSAADAYAVAGEITRFERTSGSSEYRLMFDGQDVTGRLTA